MKIRLNRLTTATAFTLAALLLLSSASQAAAVVVCVGLDDHVDIESIFDSCCISDATEARGPATELAITGAGCSGCTDVPLKAPPLRSEEDLQLQPDGDAGCSLCSMCSSTEGVATAQITDMDQHWQALVPLTTVVLLT